MAGTAIIGKLTGLDFAALGIAAVFMLIGAKRGLFKTLADIAVVIAAMLGAGMIATALTGTIAEWVVPQAETYLRQQIGEAVSGLTESELEETPFNASSAGELDRLLEGAARSNPALAPIVESFRENLNNLKNSFAGSVAQAITAALVNLLRPALYGIVYFVSFVVLSMILRLLVKTMTPLTNLPVLHTMNVLGGAALGLAEGCCLGLVVLFVLDRLRVFPGMESLPQSGIWQMIAPR